MDADRETGFVLEKVWLGPKEEELLAVLSALVVRAPLRLLAGVIDDEDETLSLAVERGDSDATEDRDKVEHAEEVPVADEPREALT